MPLNGASDNNESFEGVMNRNKNKLALIKKTEDIYDALRYGGSKKEEVEELWKEKR